MVLPFGAAPEEHPQPGNVESAPARPRLLLKALITTVLAALATWGIAWFIAQRDRRHPAALSPPAILAYRIASPSQLVDRGSRVRDRVKVYS